MFGFDRKSRSHSVSLCVCVWYLWILHSEAGITLSCFYHKRLVIIVCILIVLTTPRWLPGHNLPLGGGPAQMSDPGGPSDISDMVIISPGAAPVSLSPEDWDLPAIPGYWSFIPIITKTPAIFSLRIIDFTSLCSHTRQSLLVPGSLLLLLPGGKTGILTPGQGQNFPF